MKPSVMAGKALGCSRADDDRYVPRGAFPFEVVEELPTFFGNVEPEIEDDQVGVLSL
jgi:hypothetical protein